MTGKRFKEERGIAKFIDNQTGKEYSEYNLDEIVCLLNELHEQNQYLKSLKWNQDCINEISISMQQIQLLEKENEQLKTTIKEVTELLIEEVDLFSDKATEHDINAYVELKELDNKDAYYMATSTKKAIQMLKEFLE